MHDYTPPVGLLIRNLARRLALGTALGLWALVPLRAPAQLGISHTGVSKTDKAFANEIAPGLQRDMDLAATAAHRGEDKAVRQFASAVLEHRTKAHGKLRALAKKTRLVPPDRLGAHQQMQVNQLRKWSAGQAVATADRADRLSPLLWAGVK